MLKTLSSARRTRRRSAPPASRPSPCSARTWPATSWARSGSASWRSGWPPSARPTPRRDPGLRGRAGRPGRSRLHPDGDRDPADLPVRAGLDPGGAGRRAARRRLAVPRRHRGLRPVPARRARARRRRPARPTTPAGTPSRWSPCSAQREARRFVPGLGHHVHKEGDPRTPRLFQIAAEEGLFGPHLSLFAAIGRVHPQVLGKTLPLNGAGVCGAALADLGLPLELLRGFALLARTAGLIGQLAEEHAPPGRQRDLPVGGPATTVPSTPTRTCPIRSRTRRPTEVVMAELAAVIASTHHPFYYRASTATGEDRPPFADEWVAKIERFRETLTARRARRAGHGRQRPLPPAVAGQHAAVPRRQGAVVRRQLVQRGTRVRPTADAAQGRRGPGRALAA